MHQARSSSSDWHVVDCLIAASVTRLLQITLGRGRALRGVDASKLSEATTLKGKRMVGGRLRGELLEEADECGARVGTLVKFGPC